MKRISYNQYKLLHFIFTCSAIISGLVELVSPSFLPLFMNLLYCLFLILSLALSIYSMLAMRQSKWVFIDELSKRNEGMAAQCAIAASFLAFLALNLIHRLLNRSELILNRHTIFLMYLCLTGVQDVAYLIFERRGTRDAGIGNED